MVLARVGDGSRQVGRRGRKSEAWLRNLSGQRSSTSYAWKESGSAGAESVPLGFLLGSIRHGHDAEPSFATASVVEASTALCRPIVARDVTVLASAVGDRATCFGGIGRQAEGGVFAVGKGSQEGDGKHEDVHGDVLETLFLWDGALVEALQPQHVTRGTNCGWPTSSRLLNLGIRAYG